MTRFLSSLVMAMAMALLVAACAADPAASPSEAAIEALDDDGGDVMAYASLDEKVLDSDAVILGQAVDVTLGVEERVGDDSGDVFVSYDMVVRVDEVIYSAPGVEVEEGALLTIAIAKPADMGLNATRKALASEVRGVHVLFNAQRLAERMGEISSSPRPNVWIHQDSASVFLEDEAGSVVERTALPVELSRLGFAEAVQATEDAALRLENRNAQQPPMPIGLQDLTEREG